MHTDNSSTRNAPASDRAFYSPPSTSWYPDGDESKVIHNDPFRAKRSTEPYTISADSDTFTCFFLAQLSGYRV